MSEDKEITRLYKERAQVKEGLKNSSQISFSLGTVPNIQSASKMTFSPLKRLVYET